MQIITSLFYAYLSFYGINYQLPLPDRCADLQKAYFDISNPWVLTYHKEMKEYLELIKIKYKALDCKKKLSYDKKYDDRQKQAHQHAYDAYENIAHALRGGNLSYKNAYERYSNAYLQVMHCAELKKYLEKNSPAQEETLSTRDIIILHDIKNQANNLHCFHQDSK